jgi:hypothetical protein
MHGCGERKKGLAKKKLLRVINRDKARQGMQQQQQKKKNSQSRIN